MNKFIKKIMLLLGCLISFCAGAQNLVSPITINLPANPPANTADWATAVPPVMILAQTKLVNGQVNGLVQESRILVTIKSAGNKVCGTYTPQNAPMSSFSSASKNWSGANVLSLLGQECTLKPGSYELCVQFYSMPGAVQSRILGESCKPFTIADKKDKPTYSPPTNVSPVNEKTFTEKELIAPVTFRWTPIIPRPKDPVVYKLRVWQLMQGQSATQAMKTTTPIVEEEVTNITQMVKKITFPPNAIAQKLFTWNVEASKKNAMGEVEMLGVSEASAFSIQSGTDVSVTKDSVFCKNQQGVYPFKFTILNNNNYNRTFTNLSVYSINAVVQGTAPNYLVIPASQLTPGIGANIAANNSLTVTGNLNYSGNINEIIFLGSTSGGIPPKSGDFDFTDTLRCICTSCDSIKINLPPATKGQLLDNVTISQSISTQLLPSNAPLAIKSITAEIIYFDIVKNDTLCYRCEKNSDRFGKFKIATISNTAFTNTTTTLPNNEVLFTATTAQALTNATFNFEIAAPDINKCCTDKINACIRYTIVTQDCKTCSITQCYELPRTK